MNVRCPHCRNSIELVDDTELSGIVCSSCGSSFSLLSEETITDHRACESSIAHFKLIEQVGIGGFGAVWKATDTKLDRTVAIKIPRKDQLSQEETEQFLREARSAAQLNHSNIVSVHEVGSWAGQSYIVSDFVEGVTLSSWLTGRKLSWNEAAELCAQIGDALHHAHENGVIHRDLKPANIIIDGNGKAHIMDFGLAKRNSGEVTMTVDGKILGTPAYMSPEQAKGSAHTADARSDVYSLGVIFFELITGDRPFRGDARMLIYQVIHDDAPSPRSFQSTLPRDLETICKKCLEKSPERRYSSAQGLVEDLRRFLRKEPIHAKPISVSVRFWRWCRKNRLAASVAAALTLLTVSAWLVMVVLESQRRQIQSKSEELQKVNFDLTAAFRREKRLSAMQGQLLYLARISRAFSACRNDPYRAQELLTECPEEKRGWEWHYVNRLCNLDRFTFDKHEGVVTGIAIYPDGRRIVTSGADNTLKTWSVQTGQVLVEAQHDLTGRKRGLAGDHVPAPLQRPGINCLALDRVGRRIATAGNSSVRLLNAESGLPIWTKAARRVSDIAISSNGKHIATRGERVRIWDAESGKLRFEYDPRTLQVISSAVEFSPDSKWIAIAGLKRQGFECVVIGIDIETEELSEGRKLNSGQPLDIVFSPDGSRIALGDSRGDISIWNSKTLQLEEKLIGHDGPVNSVMFSHYGTQLLSGGHDRTARVWDIRTGKVLYIVRGHSGSINQVAYSPDGKWIATASLDGTARIWDIANHRRQESTTIKRRWNDFTVGPDGRTMARCDFGSIILSDRSGMNRRIQMRQTSGCIAFWPNGKRVAVGCDNHTVKVFEVATGADVLTLQSRIKVNKQGNGRTLDVAIDKDGRRIIAGGSDSIVRVWDVKTRRERLTFQRHESAVGFVTFSPSGTYVASVSAPWHSSSSTGVQAETWIWNVQTAKEILALKGAHSVAFGPDGQRFATGHGDGSVRIREFPSGKELHVFLGHTGEVASVAFHPNGDRLLSTSGRRIKLWDLESGLEAIELVGHADPILHATFSESGQSIVSRSRQEVRIWDARKVKQAK